MNIAKLNKKLLFTRLFLYNIILLIFLAISGFFIYSYKIVNQKNIIINEQKVKFTSINNSLDNFLSVTKNDTLVLSNLPSTYNYLSEKNTPDTTTNFDSTVSCIMDTKKELIRLEIFNLELNRIVTASYKDGKVSFDKTIQTPPSKSRKYLKSIQKLKNNEVYILNIDYKKIGQSLSPIIELASPISYEGDIKGVMVATYKLSNAGKIFNNLLSNTFYKFYIINSNSRFLFYNSSENKLADINNSSYTDMVFKKILLGYDKFISYQGSLYYKENISLNAGANSVNLTIAVEYPKDSFNLIKNNIKNQIFHDILAVFVLTALILTLIILILTRLNLNKLQFKVFGDLIEQSNDGVLITSTEGNIIFANGAFLNLFESSAKDIISTNINRFNSDFYTDDFYKSMWERLEVAGSWEGEFISSSRKERKIYSNLKINAINVAKTKQRFLIWNYKDLTEAKFEKLKSLTMHLYDKCTGLPNKTNINRYLTNLFNSKSEFGIFSIRINNFEQVVRNYSYDSTDLIFIKLTDSIKDIFRKDIFIGRPDANKITIILPALELFGLEDSLKKALSIIRKPVKIFSDNIFLDSSVSLSFFPEEGKTLDSMNASINNYIHNIDESAENRILNTLNKKSTEMETKKLKIFKLLEKAIKNNEFSLYYQPKVDISTCNVIGAEALIRWNNSELGMVSPAVFIPISEENKFIEKITYWTLNTLCSQLNEWKKEFDTVPVSINISSLEFNKNDFADKFISVITEHNTQKSDITIEIKESLLAVNDNNIADKIKTLNEHNIKISVDDFGTGNSSLDYLKTLNIDSLKIDREFIKNYPENDNGSIAKIITDTALNLKLNVIAEGVETSAQANFLRNIGCKSAQGYYYSKPVSSAEFKNILKEKKITFEK